jgi:hypothetical protein
MFPSRYHPILINRSPDLSEDARYIPRSDIRINAQIAAKAHGLTSPGALTSPGLQDGFNFFSNANANGSGGGGGEADDLYYAGGVRYYLVGFGKSVWLRGGENKDEKEEMMKTDVLKLGTSIGDMFLKVGNLTIFFYYLVSLSFFVSRLSSSSPSARVSPFLFQIRKYH